MKYFLPVWLLTFFVCCKTTQLSPEQYDKAQIVFGSGGGFSGAYNEYTLLDDGRLFQRNKDNKSNTEIKKVDKKITTQIFNNIKTFGLDQFRHNEPQNLYYFLKYRTPADSNKIVWSGKPENQLAVVNSIYKLLIDQTKNAEK